MGDNTQKPLFICLVPGTGLETYCFSTPCGFSVRLTPENARKGFESCTQTPHVCSAHRTHFTPLICLVPWTGLEPASPCERYHLKVVCLPISAPGQWEHYTTTSSVSAFSSTTGADHQRQLPFPYQLPPTHPLLSLQLQLER